MSKNKLSSENVLIKSITGYMTQIKNGVEEKIKYKRSLELFEKNQIQTLSEKFYPTGVLKAKSFFNEKSTLIKEVFYYEDGKINYEYRYSRDNNNYITKTMYLEGKMKWNSITSKLDAEKRILLDVYKDSKDKVIREDTYKYNNNLLIAINSNNMGDVIYEYNKLNQLIKKTVTSPSSNVFGETYLYYYNNKGLLEKVIKKNEYVMIYKYIFY